MVENVIGGFTLIVSSIIGKPPSAFTNNRGPNVNCLRIDATAQHAMASIAVANCNTRLPTPILDYNVITHLLWNITYPQKDMNNQYLD